MALSSGIAIALRRIEAALDAVEAAAARVRSAAEREAELHEMAHDRSRLAEDLDRSNARAASLEGANREVARRVDAVMDAIRGVIHDART